MGNTAKNEKKKSNKGKKANGETKKKSKRNKIKALKKLKKRRKGKKKKGTKKLGGKGRQTTTTTTDTCQNITCLNNLLKVLKINKDMVQNFMQQKNRMDARLKLAGKKGNKSSTTNASLDLLSGSLGGINALSKSSPICAGRYNESKAIEGAKIFRNMTMCDKMIAEACNFSLPTSENTEVNKCNKVMGDFRRDTDAC